MGKSTVKPYRKPEEETIDELFDAWPPYRGDSTWYDLLGEHVRKDICISKKKTLAKKMAEVRNKAFEIFEEELFNDLIYNKVIYSFPFKTIYMFFAQVEAKWRLHTKSPYKILKNTGMYRVKLFLYYTPKGVEMSKGRLKTVEVKPRSYAMRHLKKALNSGHKYPTYDERIEEINEQIDERKWFKVFVEDSDEPYNNTGYKYAKKW